MELVQCLAQMQQIETNLQEKQLKHEGILSEQKMEISEKNKKWLEKTLKAREEHMKKFEEDLQRKEKVEADTQ
jgi:hypothetical protein